MFFVIYFTTAENVIGSTEASLQRKDGVDENIVSKFLDISKDDAKNALLMAKQLGFVLIKNKKFIPLFPYSEYLVTSDTQCKAIILRFILEQYKPYNIFKSCIARGCLVQDAANQTRALCNIESSRDAIIWTLTNLGTYANSLVSEGAGLFRVAEGKVIEHFKILNEIINNRESAELYIEHIMGDETINWIDKKDVFNYLVTAYQKTATAEQDPRSPIVYAGNAIDSFLSQLAKYHNLDIKNAKGINAKVEQLSTAKKITTKHKYMLKYLGHVRNAADHGTDSEIGKTWEISKTTAIEYVHVAQSTICAVLDNLKGKFIV